MHIPVQDKITVTVNLCSLATYSSLTYNMHDILLVLVARHQNCAWLKIRQWPFTNTFYKATLYIHIEPDAQCISKLYESENNWLGHCN